MNSLIEVDSNVMKSAFKVDTSKIRVDFGNLNTVLDKASLPVLDLNTVLSQINFSLSENEIQTLLKDLLGGYEDYIKNHPEADLNQIGKNMTQYLQSKEASELLKKAIEEIIKENGEFIITRRTNEENNDRYFKRI